MRWFTCEKKWSREELGNQESNEGAQATQKKEMVWREDKKGKTLKTEEESENMEYGINKNFKK